MMGAQTERYIKPSPSLSHTRTMESISVLVVGKRNKKKEKDYKIVDKMKRIV